MRAVMDRFAGLALNAILQGSGIIPTSSAAATEAYRCAEAMLAHHRKWRITVTGGGGTS